MFIYFFITTKLKVEVVYFEVFKSIDLVFEERTPHYIFLNKMVTKIVVCDNSFKTIF